MTNARWSRVPNSMPLCARPPPGDMASRAPIPPAPNSWPSRSSTPSSPRNHSSATASWCPNCSPPGCRSLPKNPSRPSVQIGEQIVAAVEKSGTWLMIGYHKRCDPATVYAKAAVDAFQAIARTRRVALRAGLPCRRATGSQGGFNDLLPETHQRANVSLALDPLPPDMEPATYAEYNSFVNYYIHQVNLLRHLLGESYRVSYADPAQGVAGGALRGRHPRGTIEMAPYHTSLDWQETALMGFRPRLREAPTACSARPAIVRGGSRFCGTPATVPHPSSRVRTCRGSTRCASKP